MKSFLVCFLKCMYYLTCINFLNFHEYYIKSLQCSIVYSLSIFHNLSFSFFVTMWTCLICNVRNTVWLSFTRVIHARYGSFQSLQYLFYIIITSDSQTHSIFQVTELWAFINIYQVYFLSHMLLWCASQL